METRTNPNNVSGSSAPSSGPLSMRSGQVQSTVGGPKTQAWGAGLTPVATPIASRPPLPPINVPAPRIQEKQEALNDNDEGGEFSHLTKLGTPDRRFKGNRELPPPPQYQTARRMGPFQDENGRIITKDGKPDRRFKGQRDISDQEAAVLQAEFVLAHYKK